MRCKACGYVVDLKVKSKRYWCRKLGLYVYPRTNGYGLERSPDGSDCCWFTLVLTEEQRAGMADIFP
jgi:hypothetical protein